MTRDDVLRVGRVSVRRRCLTGPVWRSEFVTFVDDELLMQERWPTLPLARAYALGVADGLDLPHAGE